jgi:hypothetical protein
MACGDVIRIEDLQTHENFFFSDIRAAAHERLWNVGTGIKDHDDGLADGNQHWR